MIEPDPQKITDILTLRYDPDSESTLPPIGWSDFSSDARDVESGIELRIKSRIRDFLAKNKTDRITVALSGGVDSVLALILTREAFPDLKIQCISFGFSENDPDVRAASEVARLHNADFERFFLDNFYEDLPKQIAVIGEPKINYYWYRVAKTAKRYSDILVTGDGGDELFSGYVFRYKKFLDILPPDSDWRRRAITYLDCHNRDWVEDQDQMFGRAANFSWDSVYERLRPFFENPLPPLDQVFLADYNGKLMHDWNPSYGRIYKSLGMTTLQPFLSRDVIRYAFTIPSARKYDPGSNVGKLPLRGILQKKNFTADPTKRGFTPDYPLFWNNHGKKFVQDFLLDGPRVVRDGWISPSWIQKALNTVNEAGDLRYMNKLLHVAAFEVWYGLFVTGEISEDAKI